MDGGTVGLIAVGLIFAGGVGYRLVSGLGKSGSFDSIGREMGVKSPPQGPGGQTNGSNGPFGRHIPERERSGDPPTAA